MKRRKKKPTLWQKIESGEKKPPKSKYQKRLRGEEEPDHGKESRTRITDTCD